MDSNLVALPIKNDNVLATYLASLPANKSRKTMATCLLRMRDMVTVPLHMLEYTDIQQLRDVLLRSYPSPNTANKYLSALRGYLRTAWHMGLVDADRFARISDVKNVPGKRGRRGRALSDDEITKLLDACDRSTTIGIRDAALLVCLRAGLRREEIVTLNIGDLDVTTKSLTVLGKGNKQRTVPLPNGAMNHMLLWLMLRSTIDHTLPLLSQVGYTGAPTDNRLSSQTVATRLGYLAERAGLNKTTPHDMRRTLASQLLDVTDIKTAADILGHADVRTTAGYDRRDERRMNEAMAKIEMPDASPLKTGET